MKSPEFDRAVLQSPKPVLVDFHADWCAPCRAMAPTLEALAEQSQLRLQVTPIDIDTSSELVERFDVRSIPTLVFFRDGEEIERLTGVISAAELETHIARWTENDKN